jgi:uncharacterized protein DUF1003
MADHTDPLLKNVQAVGDRSLRLLEAAPHRRARGAVRGVGAHSQSSDRSVRSESLEAIFLTSFVLMTQNRITRQADRRAHLDLQVNLLAEQALTAILQAVYALCQNAGTCACVNDPRVEKLLQETDVFELAVAIERELEAIAPEPPLDERDQE